METPENAEELINDLLENHNAELEAVYQLIKNNEV